ncbi:MAG: ImmA/IrrE family metallo-endopeptidase [Acidobacteria bacterium]|nr:ImmA/IrrE family metallo-endopeptidase [Acidobacteriota bacterium]
MALDEFTVVMKARGFVAKAKPSVIPVPLQVYLAEVGAVLRRDEDLGPDEPGWSVKSPSGRYYICVNARDPEQRQRFTVCHEIGHIVLGLKSDHATQPWSAKRPPEERMCDLFAAELLMPEGVFRPLAEGSAVSLASVDELAGRFSTSTVATGSRFAAAISTPCAFVLSEHGKVRYTSRSRALADVNAWVAPHSELPRGTVSHGVRAGGTECRGEIDADVWFSDWERGGTLLEEARHLSRWDLTLSLLWFENGSVPRVRDRDRGRRWEIEGREGDEWGRDEDEDEYGLRELDGNLRWPGKGRRR